MSFAEMIVCLIVFAVLAYGFRLVSMVVTVIQVSNG